MTVLEKGVTKTSQHSNEKKKEAFRGKRTTHYKILDNEGYTVEESDHDKYPNISKSGFSGMGLYTRFKRKKNYASLSQMHCYEYEREYGIQIKRKAHLNIDRWVSEERRTMDKAKSWKDSTKRKNQYFKERS